METKVASLEELTTEEIELILAQRRKEEKDNQENKRKMYENEKEALITALCVDADNLADMLIKFKGCALSQLEGFYATMQQYGDIKGGENNKGNFEIKTETHKIVFTNQVKKCFDERSLLAETKLKEFLNGFVKKRDKNLFKLILSLLERNSVTGDLDISNINRLYKMEEEFDDPSWREAIKLFKESYNPEGTTKYVRFYRRNNNGGWDIMKLNFASI